MTHQEFIEFLGKLTSLPANDLTEFMQISIELPTHERSRIADHLLRINSDLAHNDAMLADHEKKMKEEMTAIETKEIPAFTALALNTK